MAVITISRQLGSLGSEVAHLVAGRLGYRLVWRDLINQAARRAGAPQVALAMIDDLGLLGVCPSPKACRAYREMLNAVMREIAEQGNVVMVGRAGQVILRDSPGGLHVRVIAPLPVRVERLAQRHGISLPAAQAQIEASDRTRCNYVKRFYHVRWDDPELYDLIINTARATPQIAAGVICDAVTRSLEAGGLMISPEPEATLESV